MSSMACRVIRPTCTWSHAVAVGRFPAGIVVAPDSGRVYVAVEADCRIAVVDGRAATPVLLTSIDLPGNPAGVAWDAADQRLFVALPEAGEIAVIGADQRVDDLLKVAGRPPDPCVR